MTALTREGIEGASGRELDALVAEHVMGWRWITRTFCGVPNTAESNLEYPGQPVCSLFDEVSLDSDAIRQPPSGVPAYSTTGDGMLRVLERMREVGFVVDIAGGEQGWSVDFSTALNEWGCAGKMLPEVVCRAALIAIAARKGAGDE